MSIAYVEHMCYYWLNLEKKGGEKVKPISDLHKAAIVACVLLVVASWIAQSTTTKRELKEASKIAGTVSAVTGGLLALRAVL